MILVFPNLQTLELSLTGGAAPPAVCQTPAEAALPQQGPTAGGVVLQTARRLPKTVQQHLRKLGVRLVKSSEQDLLALLAGATLQPVSCWQQILPLEPHRQEQSPLEKPSVAARIHTGAVAQAGSTTQAGSKQLVLFRCGSASQFSLLVTEMLRLDNDRQSYRFLENGDQTHALLRVVDPPYYTLLRAMEAGLPVRKDPSADAASGAVIAKRPEAYIQQAPGVWVQWGFRHPLGQRLQPPPGKLLLMRFPRMWTLLDDGEYQDVYQAIDFHLPRELDGDLAWRHASLTQRLQVPLKLARGGGGEPGELWVIKDRPVEQLDRLVQHSNDRLISRLSFAVGESPAVGESQEESAQQVIIVRARPSKQPPPVLSLKGVVFRPYLKLPNLFLPCQQRLHPPLRRDVVVQLLARDPDQIVWLYPESNDPSRDGRFIVEKISDDAFRPLEQWVDYVVDHDQQPLRVWRKSHQFDFEPFICSEGERRSPKPRKETKELQDRDKPRIKQPAGRPSAKTRFRAAKSRKPTSGQAALDLETPLERDETAEQVNQWRQRLEELEKEFRSLNTPLEERGDLWREMATLQSRLGNRHDAAICWSCALWEEASPAGEDVAGWLESQFRGLHAQPRPSAEKMSGNSGEAAIEAAIGEALSKTDPTPAEVGLAAVYAVWRAENNPQKLAPRLGEIHTFLERNEGRVPVRVAWLAWSAFYHASGKDTLALARARDRLLEQLRRHGLRPQFDLASFLGLSAGVDTDRFRAVREQVNNLRDRIQAWLSAADGTESASPVAQNKAAPFTAPLADMMFAYALARLGETTRAQELMEQVRQTLNKCDASVAWLRQAFEHRVKQALDHQSVAERLPQSLLGELEELPAFGSENQGSQYIVNLLRDKSRILHPQNDVDPYQEKWDSKLLSDLAQAAGRKRSQILQQALSDAEMKKDDLRVRDHSRRALLLSFVLASETEFDAAFSVELLEMVKTELAKGPLVSTQGALLKSAISRAARSGQAAYAQQFYRLAEQAILQGQPPGDKKTPPQKSSGKSSRRSASLTSTAAAGDPTHHVIWAEVMVRTLEAAPMLGEAFAGELLARLPPFLRQNPPLAAQAMVLSKGVHLAGHYGQVDFVQVFVKQMETLLEDLVRDYLYDVPAQYRNQSQLGSAHQKSECIDLLFTRAFRGLQKFGLREDIGQLLARIAALLADSDRKQKRSNSRQRSETDVEKEAYKLRLRLHLASNWFYFGQTQQAVEALRAVREALFAGTFAPYVQVPLVRGFAQSLSHAPIEVVWRVLEELFHVGPAGKGSGAGGKKQGTRRRLCNTQLTNQAAPFFSVSQLEIVDSVLLTLVGEDFTLNSDSRRFLDEDEFLVRRRIHREVREAKG